MKNSAALVLATWFGCGYSPVAPGTAGSLGALAAAWLLHLWIRPPMWIYAGLALALLLPAVWAAGAVARSRGVEDPGLVVVDEVAGQWIALAAAGSFTPWQAAAAFFLFRLFDILKPWPVRSLERLPGGWGIVADDAAAGVYAATAMAVLRMAVANMVQS
ncbi:MAG: phosphatidylglycerophosphatase A [Bryobacteraceae bacterium]|nr:phosphatidylglycerophosphatase A [Bryobacteraceae bacterium]MCX7605230.1 phosphatidylglycerophosphatase A [Bryobacteraceae bacterium]